MSYVGRKSAGAALISADIPSNLNLLGDYVKIPSATSTERDALTPAVGMMLYNTTLGIMQQYSASGWASIASPPIVSSFTYPEGTALDPAGSTTLTLVITGSNFSVGATVLIDGTAPTSTARNSATQITITGFPAKSAATYANGLVVTNPTGLSGSVDIAYDAVPAWTTAAGSLGGFVEGTAFTGTADSTYPRIVAAEGSDTIDYAQVSDAGGATVITSGAGGLILQTTGSEAGYLKGTLAAGTNGQSYNLYAKAQDDENQFSAVRLFNIISYDNAATGGTTINTNDWVSNYKIHVFNIADTGTSFVANTSLSCDIIVVAGGGSGGGGGSGCGGGGAGGILFNSASNNTITNTAVTLSGSYTVTVGGGGTVVNDALGDNGNNSVFTNGTLTYTATGGGGGGFWSAATGSTAGNLGGSGGGGRFTAAGGAGISGQGFAGGAGKVGNTGTGGGGGGASEVGVSPANNQSDRGHGGDGKDYSSKFGTSVGVSGVFSGGGGSGSETCDGGNGGTGGGGKGGFSNSGAAAVAGTAHTGGGGGGAYTVVTSTFGANGGSGIVIIRYAV
jgi:hypothetical protein